MEDHSGASLAVAAATGSGARLHAETAGMLAVPGDLARRRETFACQRPGRAPGPNPNAHITRVLDRLVELYSVSGGDESMKCVGLRRADADPRSLVAA